MSDALNDDADQPLTTDATPRTTLGADATKTTAHLSAPIPIAQQSWPEGTVPVVSICCITYNHGPFIRQCLDGFLMQETTFPVEILVHDDASKDDTVTVIKEYAARYPALLKPILQSENQHSKGIPPLITFILPRTKGMYIATCEGDDYWTDRTKLQKQVEFLDSNPGYVLCYHDAIIVDERGSMLSSSKLPGQLQRDLSASELRNGAWTLTMTRCFRNVIRNVPAEYYKVLNRDTFFTVLLSNHGHGKYMTDLKPAVYRQHSGGIWSSLDRTERKVQRINTYIYIYHYLREDVSSIAARDFLTQSLLPVASEMSPKLQELIKRQASLEREIRDIRNSYTFKLGQLLAMPFRKILDRRPRK